MDVFILKLMRRRIIEGLLYLVRLRKGYVVNCEGWEDARGKAQVGCLLWLNGAEGGGEEEAPGEFATLIVGEKKRRKIPVHDLRMLLGKQGCESLRGEALEIFGDGVLAVKHKRVTVDVQMKLWRLQGYLATFGERIEEVERKGERIGDIRERGDEPNLEWRGVKRDIDGDTGESNGKNEYEGATGRSQISKKKREGHIHLNMHPGSLSPGKRHRGENQTIT